MHKAFLTILDSLLPNLYLYLNIDVEVWLSVDNNGLGIQFASDPSFMLYYPIRSLVYCATIRFVRRTQTSDPLSNGRYFVPLDSPELKQNGNAQYPPLFTTVFQRTPHLPVNECHCFIIKNRQTALALIRACYKTYQATDSEQDCSKVPPYLQVIDS